MYIKKKTFLLFNLLLLIIELFLIYFMISSFLTKDLIGPSEIPAYKYIKNKTSNLISNE